MCIVKIFLSFILLMLFCLPAYAEDVVVAKVNGTALTQKDLDTEVDRLIPQITFHRSVSQEKRKYYYEKALEEIINRELEYQGALAQGMKSDKAKVDAQMEKFKKRFKSKDAYKAALEREGVTEEKVRAAVEKELLIQAAIAKMVSDPSRVSEAELKGYYEKNASKFKQPETVKMRIISTKDEQKARDILVKLKDGDDFGDLAYNMSEDDYRVKGGDLGYIHRGRMLPEIEDAAFKLKAGELSEPIKADNRWYIIKVEDKKPEHQMSFEEVKGRLKKELETERAAELKKKWIDEMRSKAKIEILIKTES